MNERQCSFYELTRCLRFLKFLYDTGIYEKAVGNIREISEDDYFELALRGLDNAAPVFEVEELGDDVCCGGHTVYHFSSPDIPEYYRLCRLYEYKHGILPFENPYVIRADKTFTELCGNMCSDFGAGFNDDIHVREILIEICPEYPVYEEELIELVHGMMEYYKTGLTRLRAELQKGPVVWLPELPPHRRVRKKKPVSRYGNTTKKAGRI